MWLVAGVFFLFFLAYTIPGISISVLPLLGNLIPDNLIGSINGHPPQFSQLQRAHVIGMGLAAYASNHHGHYPDGKSSTEIFQQLLDGKYVTDPTAFYIPFAGKVAPVPGQKLKPENVSYDFTAGADATAPDDLPLVFSTGYRIAYVPHAAAIPRPQTAPPSGFFMPASWPRSGIAAFYKGDYSVFLQPGTEIIHKGDDAVEVGYNSPAKPDGSLANFIPADLQPDGKTYRQLTPDGPLVP
jgi:hypothetical protein